MLLQSFLYVFRVLVVLAVDLEDLLAYLVEQFSEFYFSYTY
jgi:hypothetical protein